jgi:tetratricopeptide (TPR) repeat protein
MDLFHTLREYFVESSPIDPRSPLPSDQYARFSLHIEQALESQRTDPRLWFWKGWGHHFFRQEPEFEWAEHAYERAIELDPLFQPAILALAYLHWQTARRRAQVLAAEELALSFESMTGATDEATVSRLVDQITHINEKAFKSASFDAARSIWRRGSYIDSEGLANEHNRSGDLAVWFQLFVEMGDDLDLTAQELSYFYCSFAYDFFNYTGLTEFALEVIQAFEAVLRYSGPSRERADALAYLALANSEKNHDYPSGNPKKGYRFLEELVEQYDANRENREIVLTSAYEDFSYFLLDFFEFNPVFCNSHEMECIRLFERCRNLGLIDAYYNKLYVYAGHFFYRLGKTQEAVAEFEKAYSLIRQETSDYVWELFGAYVSLGRHEEAAALLGNARISSISADVAPTVIAIIQRLNSHAQQAAFVAYMMPKSDELQRDIANLQDSLPQMIAELNHQFSSMVESLSDPQKREVSDRTIDDISQALGDRVQGMLRLAPLQEENLQGFCESMWPEQWEHFPEELRLAIIEAELLYRLLSDNHRLSPSTVVFQWGKVAEVALKQSLLLPLSEYVSRNGIGILTTLLKDRRNRVTREEVNIHEQASQKELSLDFRRSIGLLLAAKDDLHHPVVGLLDELHLDKAIWLNRIPVLLDTIRLLRNLAAHELGRTTPNDALQVRSFLVTGGLLAHFGDALERSARWNIS